MKAIQITVDDALLVRVDADPEVKALGRSAVFRRAVDVYLRQRRRRDTADAYRRAYGGKVRGPEELEGWSDEGVWPAK
jgi:metal-responsive CopG/Arc/MetJ family transcriptional regulator